LGPPPGPEQIVMERQPWNHNIHYHDLVIAVVPAGCRRALDAGCGQGVLSRQLAALSQEVIAVDIDRDSLIRVRASSPPPNIHFMQCDVMGAALDENSFDLIAAVATLHHLPMDAALERFRKLLRPGGVIVIIGLFRNSTPLDYLAAAVALPVSRVLRLVRGHTEVGAPVHMPGESLAQIREAFERALPGAEVRRRLLFRYSAVWHKPV
jgi:2-polyprenyl-3-methyl-5-hydroxy-6-metoxy-1,4-benzoquinol methylase